jgi:hypothetical protein
MHIVSHQMQEPHSDLSELCRSLLRRVDPAHVERLKYLGEPTMWTYLPYQADQNQTPGRLTKSHDVTQNRLWGVLQL